MAQMNQVKTVITESASLNGNTIKSKTLKGIGIILMLFFVVFLTPDKLHKGVMIPMSSIKSPICPLAVMQWRSLAERWGKQTNVPVALILAFIDQESGGNPKAYRPEKDYLKRYVSKSAGRIKVDNLKKETGLTEQEIITSYGLMQPLFTLAYGYGARTVEDLYDPNLNIRYCTAHIGTLMKKHSRNIRKVAGAYNGAGSNSAYAIDIEKLYAKYDKIINRKGSE